MCKLEHIKEDLESRVYEYLEANEANNFKSVCTHELGEVIDMIKDLNMAMYYHAVVAAMDENPGTTANITMNTANV